MASSDPTLRRHLRPSGLYLLSALLMMVGDLPTSASQLWQWSGSAWTIVGDGPRVDAPAPLVSLGASSLLLADVGGQPPATHRWDGTTWSVIAGTTPTRRFVPAIGYDAGRRQVVMFGGIDVANRALGDTWVWTSAGGWAVR